MKKQILSLLVIGMGLTANAQFTQSNAPAIGASQTMYVLDSNATAYPNETGSGANWDYSSIAGVNGNTNTYQIQDATTTSNASDYPNSVFASDIQGFLTTYYTTSATEQMSQGFVFTDNTLGEVEATFETDPGKLKDYPMSFGSPDITDAYAGTAHLSVFGQPMTPTMTGHLMASVDGKGTLKLHNNTYSNVIRYKLVDTMNTTLSGMFLSGPVEVTRTQYEYYDLSTSDLPLCISVTLHITGQLSVGNIDKLQHLLLSMDDPTAPSQTCDLTGLAVANITQTTADLTWDGTASDDFEYVLNQDASDPTAAGTAITGGSYNAVSLTAGETYYFHIRKICDATNNVMSPWETITITTPTSSAGVQTQKQVQFILYPNPADHQLNIQLKQEAENTQITLLDALGNVIQSKVTHKLDNSIDVSSLRSGVYFVRISNRNATSIQKVIVR